MNLDIKVKINGVTQEEYEIDTVTDNLGMSSSLGCGGSANSNSTSKSKLGTSVDIEDIAGVRSQPYKTIDDPHKICQIIRNLIEDDIINKYENDTERNSALHIFLREQARKYHTMCAMSSLLYTYRLLCTDGEYVYDDRYETLLRTKAMRSQSGVLVIAVFTSPYPGIDLTKDPATWKKLMRREQTTEERNTDLSEFDIKNNKQLMKRAFIKYTENDTNNDTNEDTNNDTNEDTNNDTNEDDLYVKSGLFSCEYDCYYCPNEPGQPRSYVMKEPGVLRAYHNMYDPILQMHERMKAYFGQGQPIDKIELLVLGGTWSSYKKPYRDKFINSLYYAANTFFDNQDTMRPMLSLKEEQVINSSTKCRIIGLTLETRPDRITARELKIFRSYGVTRVQIGVQSTYDRILKRINRGCRNIDFLNAALLLKRSGFKYDIHIMFDLPQPLLEGVDEHKPQFEIDDIDLSVDMVMIDLKMIHLFIFHPDYQADQWKIYPCETMPWTVILSDYERGVYKPYADLNLTEEELYGRYPIIKDCNEIDLVEQSSADNVDVDTFVNGFMSFIKMYTIYEKADLEKRLNSKKGKIRRDAKLMQERGPITYNLLFLIIIYTKLHVKCWVRLNRVVRDIPEFYHRGGVQKSNMRQFLLDKMSKMGYKCKCMRCSEIKGNTFNDENVAFEIIEHTAQQGQDLELRYVTKDNNELLGFLRLRLDPYAGMDITGKYVNFNDHVNSAMIRELHVYGQVLATHNKVTSSTAPQHSGLGTLLLNHAFRISESRGFNKMSVIPGEGVKGYYSKFGFVDGEYFMVKNLYTDHTLNETTVVNTSITLKPIIQPLSQIKPTCDSEIELPLPMDSILSVCSDDETCEEINKIIIKKKSNRDQALMNELVTEFIEYAENDCENSTKIIYPIDFKRVLFVGLSSIWLYGIAHFIWDMNGN